MNFGENGEIISKICLKADFHRKSTYRVNFWINCKNAHLPIMILSYLIIVAFSKDDNYFDLAKSFSDPNRFLLNWINSIDLIDLSRIVWTDLRIEFNFKIIKFGLSIFIFLNRKSTLSFLFFIETKEFYSSPVLYMILLTKIHKHLYE